MINVENHQGLFIDWDLSKYKEDLSKDAARLGVRSMRHHHLQIFFVTITFRYCQRTWRFLSALLLKYVKKPTEVVDDLESFLYVLLFMLLRFHIHNYSTINPERHKVRNAELRKHNGENEQLAKLVDSLFFEDIALEEGLSGGGSLKLQWIAQHQCGVTLTDVEDPDYIHPLQKFINNFYIDLYDHYTAIDFSQMERFTVPSRGKTKVSPLRFGPKNKASRRRPLSILPEIAVDIRHERISGLNRDSPRSTSTVGMGTDSRKLDTYIVLLETFAECSDPTYWTARSAEKTVDQFFGLPGSGTFPSEGTSGSESGPKEIWR